jgi:hypothetical protein
MCPISNGRKDTAFFNVTHKTHYKRYEEGKTRELLITFIGYVNDLSKLQQFKVCVQKSHHRLQRTFQLT